MGIVSLVGVNRCSDCSGSNSIQKVNIVTKLSKFTTILGPFVQMCCQTISVKARICNVLTALMTLKFSVRACLPVRFHHTALWVGSLFWAGDWRTGFAAAQSTVSFPWYASLWLPTPCRIDRRRLARVVSWLKECCQLQSCSSRERMNHIRSTVVKTDGVSLGRPE
jgi:hypothetical protein